jgi:hypothetical protein
LTLFNPSRFLPLRATKKRLKKAKCVSAQIVRSKYQISNQINQTFKNKIEISIQKNSCFVACFCVRVLRSKMSVFGIAFFFAFFSLSNARPLKIEQYNALMTIFDSVGEGCHQKKKCSSLPAVDCFFLHSFASIFFFILYRM